MVGVAGLEPATSSSRTMRATKLRHTPLTRSGQYIRGVPPPRPGVGLTPEHSGGRLCSCERLAGATGLLEGVLEGRVGPPLAGEGLLCHCRGLDRGSVGVSDFPGVTLLPC